MNSAPLRVTLEGHPRAHPLQGASLFLGTDPRGRWVLGREVAHPAATLIPGDGRPVLVPLGGDVFLDRRRLRAGNAVRLRGGERVRIGRAVAHVRRSDGRDPRRWGGLAVGLLALGVCAAVGGVLGFRDGSPGAGDEAPALDAPVEPSPTAGATLPVEPAPEPVRRDPVQAALAEAEGLARIGAADEARRVLLAALGEQRESDARAPILQALARLGARASSAVGPEPQGPLDRAREEASVPFAPAPEAAQVPVPAPPGEVASEPEPLPEPEPEPLPEPEPEPPAEPEALGARAPLPEPPPPPDPLQGQVERAIQQGTAVLLAAEVPTRAGAAALEAFALLRSGTHPQHPAVTQRFALFEAQDVGKTYDLALGIMAYEAASLERLAPAGGSGSRPRYARKQLGGQARRGIQALAQRLLAGQGEHGWGYDCPHPGSRSRAPSYQRCDNSNTQFAVLGLHAAQRCGVEVPRQAWERVLRHFVEDAVPPSAGEPLALSWTDERPPFLAPPEDAEATRSRRGPGSETSERRGWGYGGRQGERLSMTCAGLSSLAIAAHALEERGALGERDAEEARRLVLAGLRQVPRRLSEDGLLSQGWGYYTVYSLEKAMDVCGVQALNAVDWWRVAASGLVARQKPAGGWGQGTDTAFALLVLNRATLGLGEETRVRGGGGGGVAVDPLLVRVGRKRVYLPGVLATLVREPSGKLRRQAQRALQEVTPASRPHLVGDLTPLLDSSSRTTRTWAARVLREITEERLDAEGYATWAQRFQLLDRVQAPIAPETLATIRSTLREAPDGPLLRAAAVACVRGQAEQALGALVDALGRVEDAGTQRELCAALRLLTGEDPAEDAADAAAAWRAWLGERGE
ncbi:MAG: hypothetical protein R3F62_25395 [Planctomycetota bacterium]